MSIRKFTVFVVLGLLVIVVGGGALLVWPRYQETHRIQRDIADLNRKIADLSGTEEKVDRLIDAIGAARHRISHELREVPEASDVAELIEQLSLPVDGVTVLDQTFTTGHPVAALGREEPTRAMPLTVDMRATFDSTYALLSAAESMRRLIRITTVQLECDRKEPQGTHSILTASIGLEAVYEPRDPEEDV